VFHTIFNVLGVALMLPFLNKLILFLERRIVEPELDVSRPRYLSAAVDAFPETFESALRNEVLHLYDNTAELILHGMNLHRHEVFETDNIAETVRTSRTAADVSLEEYYERRIKTLYSAIFEFTTHAGEKGLPPDISDRVYDLRDVASNLVQAVKSIKHLRKNVLRYTLQPQGAVTELYDDLRTEIARILAAIQKFGVEDPDERSSLWLDQELAQIEADAQKTSRRIDVLIRTSDLKPDAATSFLNDSAYAYGAMRQLIEAARIYYSERDSALAEVEQLLSLDEAEFRDEEVGSQTTEDTKKESSHLSVAETR
jgi:phosphate:Na+ symporter